MYGNFVLILNLFTERNHIMQKFNAEFYAIAKPIINHDAYILMKDIRHHNESVYEHCLDTAYISYKISKKLGLDYVSATRGCLLHDFYLYKFEKGKGFRFFTKPLIHAKNHPLVALKNALEHFELNHKEQNIIKSHMFPVGMPKSREAWVVTFVDKFLAVYEYGLRAINATFEKYKLLVNNV